MMRLTIRARALALALLPATAIALILLSIFLASRLSEIETNLHQRGLSLVRQLAISSEYGVFSGNRQVLQSIAFGAMAEGDVRSVVIWSAQGGYVAKAGDVSAALAAQANGVRDPGVLDNGESIMFVRSVRLADAPSDDPLLPAYSAAGENSAGWVAVEMSRQGARAAQRELFLVSIASVLAVLAVTLVLALRISRGITKPIQRIVGAVEEIGGGDYAARVPVEGGLDLRRLGDGVNRMAARIESAQLLMQREIEEATKELREKRAEAEQANIAKTRFLAAASHDLRQPIHALGLFVDLLMRRTYDQETGHIVERIGQSIETIGSLLDSLLDISRLDAGALAPEIRTLPLQAAFDRLQDFAAEAAAKNLRLRIRPSHLWIRSDPVLLERILRNLIANAIRYTEHGTVMVAGRRRGRMLRIEIRDSGVGIDTDSQALVFHEFVQLGNPERNREKGLGLGLAIVTRLGRLLDHPIGVRSAVGRGSVFWVDVPLGLPTTGEGALSAAEGSVEGRAIVLIDDDELVLSGMSGLLENWGCQVFAGHSCHEIEVALARDGTPPELIICDHRLPDGDNGIDVVERLRRTYNAAIPAVILSGDVDPEVFRLAAERGLPLLHKPVRPAKLRATLRALLG